MANYPSTASTAAGLYTAVNNQPSTLLNGAINAVVTTITVDSTTGFPSTGFVMIETEAIKYTGTTATTFTGCTRGADGTTAAVHGDNVAVYHSLVAAHHNEVTAEIAAVESDLVAGLGALNDSATPASTATSVKDRLDQIATKIKAITGQPNWYNTGGASLEFAATVLTADTTATVNSRYFANSASRIIITLPVTSAVGSTIEVVGVGAGGWRMAQNASQIITYAASGATFSSTTGVTGYLESDNTYQAALLVCVVANTRWVVTNLTGPINLA